MDYPDFGQWETTKLTPRPRVLPRYASNGTVRLRILTTNDKYDLTLTHGMMTIAEREQLLLFYAQYRSSGFSLTTAEDGVTRYYRFAANPFNIVPLPGFSPVLFTATVNLREQ